MGAKTKTSQKWANSFNEKIVDKDNIDHNVWIVSAPFGDMPYIDSREYLPGEEPPELEHVNNERIYNVELYHTRFQNVPGDFYSHWILGFQTSQNPFVVEDQYYDCHKFYTFNTAQIKMDFAK